MVIKVDCEDINNNINTKTENDSLKYKNEKEVLIQSLKKS